MSFIKDKQTRSWRSFCDSRQCHADIYCPNYIERLPTRIISDLSKTLKITTRTLLVITAVLILTAIFLKGSVMVCSYIFKNKETELHLRFFKDIVDHSRSSMDILVDLSRTFKDISDHP